MYRHLQAAGHRCVGAWDIHPRSPGVQRANALTMEPPRVAECYITNPPWTRDPMHALIEHLSAQLPTWLLMDADWMHTMQAIPYLPWCRVIVSIGRVRWIPDSPSVGKDNSCWYLFDRDPGLVSTIFYGRYEEDESGGSQ